MERAHLESSRANELVFLYNSVPALEKYQSIINQATCKSYTKSNNTMFIVFYTVRVNSK